MVVRGIAYDGADYRDQIRRRIEVRRTNAEKPRESRDPVPPFQSDFRYVAEYFVGVRKWKEGIDPGFQASANQLKHVEEFAELMNAVTNSKKFSDLPLIIEERGDAPMMTEIFDAVEDRGEDRYALLSNKLLEADRIDDLRRDGKDKKFRDALYKEFGISRDRSEEAENS